MAIPDTVKQQADEARKQAQAFLNGGTPPEEGQGSESTDEGTPVLEPAQSLDVDELFSRIADPGEGNPPQAGGEPQAAQQGPDAQASQSKIEPDVSEELKVWQHKYSVLEGKYKAEVPRLQKENRELKEEITRLKASQQAAAEAGNTAAGKRVDEVMKKLADEFDSDTLNAIQQIAQAVAEDAGGGRSVEERVDVVPEEPAKEAEPEPEGEGKPLDPREIELDARVSNWREINVMPEFIQFLQTEIPGAGITLRDALNAHYNAGRVAEAAAIFKRFEAQQSGQAAKDKLATQAAPAAGANAGAQRATGTAKPTFRQSEIDRFERMAAAGMVKKSRKEIAAIREQFRKAAADGRISPD